MREVDGKQSKQGLVLSRLSVMLFFTPPAAFGELVGKEVSERDGTGEEEPPWAPHPHPLLQALSCMSLSPAVVRKWD